MKYRWDEKYSELIYQYGGGISGGKAIYRSRRRTVGWVFARVDGGVAAGIGMRFAAAGSMVGFWASWFAPRGVACSTWRWNAVRFFRNESCGKCVPCRVGSQKMTDMLTAWTQGKSGTGICSCWTSFQTAIR